RFDHARATPWTSRNANKRDGLVYVLAQQQIEHGFQRAGIAVVVFRSDDHEPVGLHDRVAPLGELVFYFLAVVVVRKIELGDVEKARANLRSLLHLADRKSV